MRFSLSPFGCAALLGAAVVSVSALPAAAQAFDPKMPGNVPAVSGKTVDAETLRYIDFQEGSGAPAQAGQEYTVHYTGWLRDGTKFDSSVGKDPLKFVQGRRNVIAGWEMGFEGMKVGGKRRLFIPYQLAYGEAGRGSIPPGAELVFDVELLDAKAAPPAPPAAADVAMALKMTEDEVMALAKAVPEDKYAWTPGPGVRSFQQVFLHIALANRLLMKIADASDKDEIEKTIAANEKAERQPISKEKTIAELTASFAAVHEYLDAVTARSLGRDADFFGTASTKRGVLVFLDTHIGEHLGQAIAYARVNGIVPPWSK
jgi:peptidylprolyl isomerase